MSSNSQSLKHRAIVWLIFAGLFCALWVFLWSSNDNKEQLAIRQPSAKNTPDYSLPTTINELDELSNLVSPIDFQTITRDLRHYPDEFKDKKYFQSHKNKWTVQIMDVAEHKVIVDYLDNQPYREKFAYFRYTDDKANIRYLLTYGVMSSFQEALGATKLIDFRLPNSTRVLPEEMQRYVDMIDDYERGVPSVNDDTQALVKLTQAVKQVPAEPIRQTTAPQADMVDDDTQVMDNPADGIESSINKFTDKPALSESDKPAKTNKPKPTEGSPAAQFAEELQ